MKAGKRGKHMAGRQSDRKLPEMAARKRQSGKRAAKVRLVEVQVRDADGPPIVSADTHLPLVAEELSGTVRGTPVAKLKSWERRIYHEARVQDIAEELAKLAGEIVDESPLWPEVGMAAHYLSVRLQHHLRELVGTIKIADHADQFNFCRWCGRRLPETAEECYARDRLKGKPRSRWNKAEEKAFEAWVQSQPSDAGFVESDADLKAGGRKRRYCDDTCKECCQGPSDMKHIEKFLRGVLGKASK